MVSTQCCIFSCLYAVDASGGSADAIVVSHTHSISLTDPGHGHPYRRVNVTGAASDATGGGILMDFDLGAQQSNYPAFNGTPANNAGEAIGGNTTGISVTNASTGTSGTNANLPPYYALCYIMKT